MRPTVPKRPGPIGPVVLGLAMLAILASASGYSAAPPTGTPPAEFRSIDGKLIPLAPEPGGATAVVFYSTECPISNAYSPTLAVLRESHPSPKFRMVGICVDADLPRADIAKHAKEFGLNFPIAVDRDGLLAAGLGVKVTPEAVVLDHDLRARYRGRIDDQYAARGKRNAQPQTAELREAVEAVLAGRDVAVARVDAVGCPVPTRPKAEGGPTYAKDVAPILQDNCMECHRTGQVGPFELATYEQARKRAGQIVAETAERRMPPWKADPGVGVPFAHSKALTAGEIATLAAWAEAGAPSGNLAEVPTPPSFSTGWALGVPDLVVEAPEDYAIPASGEDVYRCFVIPTNLPKDMYVSAVEYRPGNRKVVHHIIGYVDTSGEGRKKDRADAGGGYMCFGDSGLKSIHGDLGGWAPGSEASFLPEGIGRSLPKGSDVIMQVHYHPSGKTEVDRTRIGLYFARGPIRRTMHWNFAINPGLVLPAGDPRVEIKARWEVPVDVTALSVLPHMHMLGKDMLMTVTFPDGREQDLIKIGDWDFNWQNTYWFQRPIELPKGSRLDVVAHFDNSSGNPRNPRRDHPVEVKWGEATTDEMCIGFISVVKKGQDLTKAGEVDDLKDIFDRQIEERRAKMQEHRKRMMEEEARKKAAASR